MSTSPSPFGTEAIFFLKSSSSNRTSPWPPNHPGIPSLPRAYTPHFSSPHLGHESAAEDARNIALHAGQRRTAAQPLSPPSPNEANFPSPEKQNRLASADAVLGSTMSAVS